MGFLKLNMGNSNDILSFEDLFSMIEEGQTLFRNSYIEIIELAERLEHKKAELLSEIPFPFNVISMAARGKLKETAHSAILQRLLTQKEILYSFIENIVGIDSTGFNTDQVQLPDTDRIDVCIRSDKYCIIIENKVNSAVEQPGQIYRYVCLVKKEYPDENIYVVYLNPDHYEKPSDFSLTEEGKGEKRIPEEIENRLIIKNYSCDIYNWIKSIFNETELNESNKFLWSALHQYIDYLENTFYLTNKYSDMNRELRKIIEARINASSLDERISKLQNMKEKVDLLQKEISKLYDESTLEKDLREWGERAPQLAKEIGLSNELQLVSPTTENYNESQGLCVVLEKDGKKFIVAYAYYQRDPNKPFIGVGTCSNSFDNSFIMSICQTFKDIGLSSERGTPNKFWIQFAYLPKEDASWKQSFKQLIDRCIELSKQ